MRLKNDKAKFKIEFKKRDYGFLLKPSNLSMGYRKITFQEDQVINSSEAGQAFWVIRGY